MLFHFAPSSGWMNDPNGLVHWRGRHHLFYQHNPHGTQFADIGWGHASSPDLIEWREHDEALRPGYDGTAYDADGCYSGCAVAVDDEVLLVYTGVAGKLQLPCLAWASGPELLAVTKDPANPVIEDWPRPDVEAFRDHSVHRVDQGWHQAIGGRTAQNGGAIFGFTSANLRDWRYDRLVLDAASSDVPDSVWECPDLFTVGDTTVLIVSLLDLTRPFSAAEPCVWYAAGDWIDGRLHPRTTAPLDNGDRFYAPQSYWTDDGRRIQFGWIRTDLDPAVSGVSRGVMSAPRELSVDRGKVRCTPARELTRLRDKPARTVVDADATSTTIEMSRSAAVEVVLDEQRVPIKRMQLIDDETGDRLDLDLAPCGSAADEAPLTLLFDHGIVEVFRDGAPATWTQLSTPLINRVRIEHSPAPGAASVTAWTLRRP